MKFIECPQTVAARAVVEFGSKQAIEKARALLKDLPRHQALQVCASAIGYAVPESLLHSKDHGPEWRGYHAWRC